MEQPNPQKETLDGLRAELARVQADAQRTDQAIIACRIDDNKKRPTRGLSLETYMEADALWT